ncbi:unnamed protein product, partial [Closterium sp. Naga37s-1]
RGIVRRASAARVGRAQPPVKRETAPPLATLLLSASPSHPSLHQARALLAWHRSARFCGTCGARTAPCEAGNRRLCPVAACRSKLNPRIDPLYLRVWAGERVRVLLEQ